MRWRPRRRSRGISLIAFRICARLAPPRYGMQSARQPAIGQGLLGIQGDDVRVLQTRQPEVLFLVVGDDLEDDRSVGERRLGRQVRPPRGAAAELGEQVERAERGIDFRERDTRRRPVAACGRSQGAPPAHPSTGGIGGRPRPWIPPGRHRGAGRLPRRSDGSPPRCSSSGWPARRSSAVTCSPRCHAAASASTCREIQRLPALSAWLVPGPARVS